jgi:hypothetical protein
MSTATIVVLEEKQNHLRCGARRHPAASAVLREMNIVITKDNIIIKLLSIMVGNPVTAVLLNTPYF